MKNKRNWSSPRYDPITNYWIKKLSTNFKEIAIALTEIINGEILLQQWLTEGKCLMIPKTANPTVKDHRPITLLNTMYKATTSVIIVLKWQQTQRPSRRPEGLLHWLNGVYRQPCHRQSDTGGCRDQKEESLLCMDWCKESIWFCQHKWLELCLQIHCIPDKIAKFITTTMKNWLINPEIKTLDTKATIGPIKLNQGTLQGDSFCVRLFTICLDPIAWFLRGTEGYTFSHDIQEKITCLLFVHNLKSFHKSTSKAMLMTRKMKNMFEDIGLQWGLDKYAAVYNIQRGKIFPTLNINLSKNKELKMLNESD